MEWVETRGKSLEEAKEEALDRLGIGPDDAEFEVIEEPRTGLFGRVRGEARVRARVRPATVRPKQDRRNRRRSEGRTGDRPATPTAGDNGAAAADAATPAESTTAERRRRPERRARGR